MDRFLKSNTDKRIIVGLLSLITLILFAIEANLLTTATKFIQVYDSVPDEVWFYKVATRYGLDSGMAYAYGAPFWWLSKSIIKLSHPDFSDQIITLRVIFLSFKYLAFIFFTLALWQLRNGFLAAVFYITLLLTPGFYFYGKIFSPDYMVICLLSLAVYCLVRDKGNIANYFYGALFFGILSVITKLSTLPFLVVYIFYIIGYRQKLTSKKFFYSVLTSLTALIGASALFTKSAWHETLFALKAYVAPFSFTWHNFKMWLFFDNRTWEQIANAALFTNFKPLFIFLLLIILNAFLSIKHKNAIGIIDSKLNGYMLDTGFLMILFICSSTFYVMWYLFSAYVCILFGIFSCLFFKYEKKGEIALLLCLVIVYSVNIQRIFYNINYKENINFMLNQNYSMSGEINDYILARYPQGGIIATDILTALNEKLPLHIYRIRDYFPCNPDNLNKKVDFILVNSQIKNSPIIYGVYHNRFNSFIFVKNFNGLILYKNIIR